MARCLPRLPSRRNPTPPRDIDTVLLPRQCSLERSDRILLASAERPIMRKTIVSLAATLTLLAVSAPAQAQFFNFNPYPYGYTNYGREGGFLIGASSVIDSSGQL